MHPSGKFAAILHAGYSQHEIVLVDLGKGAVASRTTLGEAFYGIEFSADGRRLYCSGAGEEVVHAYDFQSGQLTNHQALKLRDRSLRGVPSGARPQPWSSARVGDLSVAFPVRRRG